MNILMLVTKRQNRGAEISAANLSKQLIEMGHFIIWVGLYSPTNNDILEVGKAINLDLKGKKNKFLSLRKTIELRDLMNKYNVDILQANGSDTFKYAVAATLFLKKPKILYRNISHIGYWIKANNIKKEIYRLLFKKADAIASVSQAAAQEFSDLMNVSLDKIQVIKRGIPYILLNKEKSRNEIYAEFDLIATQKLIVWAGALSAEKNPLLALQIMKQLNKVRKDCTLIIAGVGPEEVKLIEFINRSQLTNVLLVGFSKDIHRLLAAADVLLLTSFIEGVPGIVLEAAAQKTPTIAVDCGSTSEALLHKKTGFLIKNHDPIEFTEAINRLFNSEQLSLEFGNEALAHVNREHNENRNANKFEALYQTLLSR
jgi:glycosyltransferase involved in cell wall biosynthesis